MAEHSNLVIRLREVKKWITSGYGIVDLCEEAADEIEILRKVAARFEWLLTENGKLIVANAEVTKLNGEQAETIERLRGALKETAQTLRALYQGHTHEPAALKALAAVCERDAKPAEGTRDG